MFDDRMIPIGQQISCQVISMSPVVLEQAAAGWRIRVSSAPDGELEEANEEAASLAAALVIRRCHSAACERRANFACSSGSPLASGSPTRTTATLPSACRASARCRTRLRRFYLAKMLPQPRSLRFLLADDPGAGKTIMAGCSSRRLQLP